jgi:diguanylate cyclase (GGDEF)-like protein/PAS domain S-box-containing protein
MLSGQQYQARLRRTAGAFELAREGILITSVQGEILDTNPAFTRITGYSRDEVVGRTPAMLQSGRQGPDFYRAMWQTLGASGHWEGEVWNRRKDGELYLETLTISALRDSDGAVSNYIGFFADVTLQKEHNSRLEQLANYDALTGLPNRRLLMDRLRQAMAQARQHSTLAVLYLDLDGFKAVNDRFDHAHGDALLVTLGRRMTQAVRASDTVARVGGDEFVVVLQNLASIADCIALLERLRGACRQVLQCGQRRAQVSASIGVTFFDRRYDDPYQLLQRADRAMYQAKATGKDRYQFSGDGQR